MSDERITFLRARLDEGERFARTIRIAALHRENMLREIKAKRAIVDACEHALELIFYGHRADFARGVPGMLCGIWAAHRDYKPGWAENPLPFGPLRDGRWDDFASVEDPPGKAGRFA